MNVTQLMARLSRGPLSNLSMSNDGDGTIKVARHAAVVDAINEGLLRLYSRFDLLENELIIEQMETVTSYRLESKYALTQAIDNPTLPHYIIDSETVPYTDDLIKVLSVYQTGGAKVPLNDDNHSNSLFTPQHNVLQVPDPEHGAPLYLIYQAKHPLLSPDALDTEIVLPTVLEEALIAYAAHKIYFHMNGQEHAAKAGEHLSTYESVCAEVLDRDLVSSSLSMSSQKFSERGFR